MDTVFKIGNDKMSVHIVKDYFNVIKIFIELLLPVYCPHISVCTCRDRLMVLDPECHYCLLACVGMCVVHWSCCV